MDRQRRRKINRDMKKNWSNRLQQIPKKDWPDQNAPTRTSVWRSNKYLVQQFHEENNIIRLSICRAELNSDGEWEDGLSWDELQAIKYQIGYGEFTAVEVYPSQDNIVNVANFRHLWILPLDHELPFGWKRIQWAFL